MPTIRSSRLYFLLPRMLCNALVAGGRLFGVEQQATSPVWGKLCESHNFPHPGHIACCSTPNGRPPTTKTLHTIRGNNTSIVWSSWWWAYKCPRNFEQIINAIKHSVASGWVSFSTRNPLTPNDQYMSCTAPLTSKHFFLYIYWTNTGTQYFKHTLYSPSFSLQNAVCFVMLTCLVPVLFTFYLQVCWN